MDPVKFTQARVLQNTQGRTGPERKKSKPPFVRGKIDPTGPGGGEGPQRNIRRMWQHQGQGIGSGNLCFGKHAYSF